MKAIIKILLIWGILAQTVSANVIAVLEIISASDEVDLSVQELRHLTDELRNKARETLPRNSYTILTRDNILQLLPPDEDEANCIAEGCVVEIGRAIGAEYVTQGSIGKFQGMLSLTVELYESMSGNMLGSFVTESQDARGLLGTIREKAPGLFAKLKPSEELKVQTETLDVAQLSTLNSQLTTKGTNSKRNSVWVALSLDVLGAAALGFGIYQHMEASKKHSDYKKKPGAEDWPKGSAELENFQATKKAELQKVNDAEKRRNIGLALGGALLAAGITVHIWF